MQQIDTLLLAQWIIPIEPANQALTHHAIAVDQGNIIAILPQDQAQEQFQAKNTVDLKQHVLLPGLINTHTHSPMTLFRGMADDLELMDWLQNHIWPAESAHMNEAFVRDGTNIAIGEMIKSGTTCINEHYFFPEVTADCIEQSGLRAVVGLLIINVPTAWTKTEDEAINKALAIFEKPPTSDRVTWAWAPHGPYTTTDKNLAIIKKHADENNLRVHIHMHESRAEIEGSLSEFNMRPLQRFKALGLLNERFINVHMTQLTDEEIKWVAEAGAHVAHCPESNLKLASGYCPVQQLFDAGVNVSLGTDGAASNNDLDMFGEMRTAALIGKTIADNPTAVSAMTALEMATINGAKALGLEKVTGSLVVGKSADIIAVDLAQLQTQPLFNPISQLVYATNAQQVTDVWVAGKQLLNNRQLTTLDESELLKTAQRWHATLSKKQTATV